MMTLYGENPQNQLRQYHCRHIVTGNTHEIFGGDWVTSEYVTKGIFRSHTKHFYTDQCSWNNSSNTQEATRYLNAFCQKGINLLSVSNLTNLQLVQEQMPPFSNI